MKGYTGETIGTQIIKGIDQLLQVELSTQAEVELEEFLLYHEKDIADDYEDFGPLRYVFRDIIGRAPNA